METGESEALMLTIDGVAKSYTPGQPVLQNISLDILQGEVVCLLGPSGCGKSTLLRIIAGLEQADSGQLTIDGRDLKTIPVHQRNFGLMFQDFALFPHRSVAENIAFGLRMAGLGRPEIAERVAEVLALVSLTGYENRSVFALSGGERQRVALARSLAPKPRLLMLDEPLGSLDRTLRDDLVAELRAILEAIHVTALYVTHDQQEAFTIADRLVLMRNGQIEQVDAPLTVYQQPANAFIARFLGFHNLLPLTEVTEHFQQFILERDASRIDSLNERMLILLRPDAVMEIEPEGTSIAGQPANLNPPQCENVESVQKDQSHSQSERELVVRGKVQQLMFLGALYRLRIACEFGDSTTNNAPNQPSSANSIATNERQPLYQCSFDIPTIQITPYLAALKTGAPVTLYLNPAAITLVQP